MTSKTSAQSVLNILAFDRRYAHLAQRLATAVTAHATPNGQRHSRRTLTNPSKRQPSQGTRTPSGSDQLPFCLQCYFDPIDERRYYRRALHHARSEQHELLTVQTGSAMTGQATDGRYHTVAACGAVSPRRTYWSGRCLTKP